MEYFLILLAGTIACISMDIWQRLMLLLFSIPPSNWSIVGRWSLELLKNGEIFNNNIEKNKKLPYEELVGWIVHYSVGILYAFIYWFCSEKLYIISYNIIDAAIFGAASVIVPWFFFLPALGKGVLASKTTNPRLVCFLALKTHIIFGVSLGISLSLLS